MPTPPQSLIAHCQAVLAAREATGQRRVLRPLERREGAYLWRDGRRLVNFSSNDYLGLSQHPAVLAALSGDAGAGASRLVSGESAAYAPLEAALATHHGMEAARVFSSGYAANLGTIAALMGDGDLILADKLSHASMLDGATLSGARLKRFAHNDLAHARALLQAHRASTKHCLLMTEAIFGMDGDAAPLEELAGLAREFDAWLLVDVAHAFSAGDTGATIIVGTLSKSLGGVGGYVAAPASVIDYLTQSARSLVYSTALPPANLAASLVALQMAEREPERAERACALAKRLAQQLGLPKPAAAIVPVPVGDEAATLAQAVALEQMGFAVAAIRPPTVPPGTARLRISCTALHTEEQIDALAAQLRQREAA